jgi:hypothetical protein
MLIPLLSFIQLAPARKLHVCLVANTNAYGASSDHKLTPILSFSSRALAFHPAKRTLSTLHSRLHSSKIPFKTHNRALPISRPRPPQNAGAFLQTALSEVISALCFTPFLSTPTPNHSR